MCCHMLFGIGSNFLKLKLFCFCVQVELDASIYVKYPKNFIFDFSDFNTIDRILCGSKFPPTTKKVALVFFF